MSKSVTDENIDYGSNYQLSSQAQLSTLEEEFQREGYVISSWNTSADGSGDSYSLEQVLTADKDLDFYAQWELLKGQIIFNTNYPKYID